MKNVDLSVELVRVTERAAIAAARTMGQGDRKYSDQVAVEAMRQEMETVDVDGTIVIGEGERDEAPMLFIGEKVGRGGIPVDIAVDPLEGTNLCAVGAPNSIAVLAAAEKGGLLNAPDIYMEKLVVGPTSKGKVDIKAPVEDNLKAIAQALDRKVADLVVVVLDRPRHERLIADIRRAGARIRLIGDGDLSAAITAAVVGTGVHAVMGTGGAPEGVISAAALRCLNGEIQARLVLTKPADARAPAQDGHLRPRAGLLHRGPGPGQEHHVRRHGRQRGLAPGGRALLRRRRAHPHPGDDHHPAPGALHRHDPRRRRPGRPHPVLGGAREGRARPGRQARPLFPPAAFRRRWTGPGNGRTGTFHRSFLHSGVVPALVAGRFPGPRI